jgi:hypothetical protein
VRNAGRPRDEGIGVTFLVGDFGLGADEPEIVAQECAEIPAVVVFDIDGIPNAGDRHIHFVVDDHAEIGTEISVAVLGYCRRSQSRRRNCHSQRNLSHIGFPFEPAPRLVIPACFAGNQTSEHSFP